MQSVKCRHFGSGLPLWLSSTVGAIVAAAMMLGLASGTQVMAQQAGPSDFTRDQLEAFAAASLRVEELNAEWMPRLSEAETPAENNEMRSTAMQEMKEAVREEGLSIDEYNGIFDAAQRDPQIMQIVERLRQDLR